MVTFVDMNTEETIEYIEHKGIVTEVNIAAKRITVSLDDTSECGECPAAKLCGAVTDVSNKVEVPVADPSQFKKGDGVILQGSERLHRKAILLATVIPSVLLVAVMTGVFMLTGNQLTACLSGIGAMILFFILLWSIRNKLEHEFTFEVREIETPHRPEPES